VGRHKLFDVEFKILISRFKLKTKGQDFGFVLSKELSVYLSSILSFDAEM